MSTNTRQKIAILDPIITTRSLVNGPLPMPFRRLVNCCVYIYLDALAISSFIVAIVGTKDRIIETGADMDVALI